VLSKVVFVSSDFLKNFNPLLELGDYYICKEFFLSPFVPKFSTERMTNIMDSRKDTRYYSAR
jgi:hypothetical protein